MSDSLPVKTPLVSRSPYLSVLVGGAVLAFGYVQICTRWGDWRTNALFLALAAMIVFILDTFPRIRLRDGGLADRSLVAKAVLAGVLFAFLFVFLAACADKVRQIGLPDLIGPFSVNTIEGREAVKAGLMRQGQIIYSPLTGYPFLITLYPPLYYVVSAAMALLVGPGLLAAKLASLAGLGLMLAMMYVLVRRRTGSRLLTLAAPLVFFLTPEATCGFLCKPDTLAFGLVLAACVFFEGVADDPTASRHLTFAAICLALAAFAKQQTWLLAAGFLAYGLAVPKLRRRLPRFLLVALLAGAVLAAVFFLYAGKELFSQVVLFPSRMTTLENLNRISTAWERLREYGETHVWLLGAYAGWLSLCLYRRRLPLADLLALVSLPALFRVLAWSGSDINHFLFFSSVAAMGAVRLVGAFLAGPAPVIGLGLVFLAGFQPVTLDLGSFSASDFTPKPAAAALYNQLLQVVAETPGLVLMDAEGAYPFLGRPEFSKLRLYDAFETDLYDQLDLLPLLSSPIAADIRSRRFSRFVDSDVILSTKLKSLLSYYYAPERRIDRYTLYGPRLEQAIVAIPAVDRKLRSDEGLTAVMVEADNVKVFGNHIEADDRGRPFRLVYEVRGRSVMETARIIACPRIVAPDGAIGLAFENSEGKEKALTRFTWDNTKRSGEGWDNRSEVVFSPGSDAFRVVFTFTPDAELWLDEAHPLAVLASYR
jgi:hypothetical protein